MRRVLLTSLVLGAAVAFIVLGSGAGKSKTPHYEIQLDNAFGLVSGADFKVAGVRAGKITSFKLDKNNRALVGIQVNVAGFGAFHRDDVHCQSRPQSLIGEYFIDCDPGTQGPLIANGGIIPVEKTESTVAPDLVNNVLRLPYRERLRLLIDELGAAVAGNGEALNEALHRANPALRDTDRVLALLARQRHTITDLTSNADTVLAALAQNKGNVARFVTEAKRTAQASAERRADLQATFHKFPAFLEELKPTMAALGRTADAQRPALANLSAAAPQLTRFFHDLVPFSQASTPAFKALGEALIPGRQAVRAAGPTISLLNQFAKLTPEVGKNLAIILRDLDDPKRAVENDPRATAQTKRNGYSGGKGYTGLQALLQYVFNQSLAVNSFDSNGQHLLRVNAFVDPVCGPYTDTKLLKQNYKKDPVHTLKCLGYLGVHQANIALPGAHLHGQKLICQKIQAGDCNPTPSASPASTPTAAPRTHGSRRAVASPGSSTPPVTPSIGDILNGIIGGNTPGVPVPTVPGTPKLPVQPPAANSGSGLLNYLLAP
jgi:virulence factor Mce-like protein